MKPLLLLCVYCISLLWLELQALHALPVGDRLDFMTKLQHLKEEKPILHESNQATVEFTASLAVTLDRTTLWRALLLRNPPAPFGDQVKVYRVSQTARPVGGASSEQEEEEPKHGGSRSRRHVYIRGHQKHHGQLMRVGCVLGTCQVHNLSHRLSQLVGQNGREDAPVNPRSPHSYG